MTANFLTVAPDLTFNERIRLGNYSRINPNLVEKLFPITADQHGEWEWKIFHFNGFISSENIRWLMKKRGFKPAKIGHILTFGEKYPEEQEKYIIIGLGSFTYVYLAVGFPGLCHNDGHELSVIWSSGSTGGGWSGYCRFLGVRRAVGR